MAFAEAYQPSEPVLQALREITLVAVVGPSGVGKTTLMKQALRDTAGLHFVLTDVSRPARPGEREAVDYNFRSRIDMLRLAEAGAYVQVAVHPSGDIYATRPDSYQTGNINLMAVLADEMPNFRRLPFAQLRTVFIVPPNLVTWQSRMGVHDFSDEQNAKRLQEAKRSLAFALHDNATLFVVNDNLVQAQAAFNHLVLNRPPTPDFTAQQRVARAITGELLAHLE